MGSGSPAASTVQQNTAFTIIPAWSRV